MLNFRHAQAAGAPTVDTFVPSPTPSTSSHPNLNWSFEQSYREACKEMVSLTRTNSIAKGLQLHARLLKSGLDFVPLVFNHLINLYTKFQLPLHSLKVFNESPLKSSTTWNSLISSFTHNNLPSLALLFFRQMLASSPHPPDDYSIPSAAKSCALLSLLPYAASLHSLVAKSGHEINVFVASSVVDMYAKCGDLLLARKLFDQMPFRNAVSWSGMMSCCKRLIGGVGETNGKISKWEVLIQFVLRVTEDGKVVMTFVFLSGGKVLL